jgi:hypothetical protein
MERYKAILEVNDIDISENSDYGVLLSLNNINVLEYPKHPKFIRLLPFLDITDYLKSIDFEKENDIYLAIREIAKIVVSDPSARDEKSRKNLRVEYELFYTQFKRVCSTLDGLENFCKSTSVYLWSSYFLPKKLRERTEKMFSVAPDKDEFIKWKKKLIDIYSFSDLDIEKLSYFICQCKDDKIHPSLNKVLYVWGGKFTGKTTIGGTVVSILNGEEDLSNINMYTSELSRELQIGQFDIPICSSSNAVLMDEAFYADMKRTYNKFKSMITSRGCKMEVKFKSSVIVDCRRNYFLTSNEPLRNFVKDWDDRRYLEIRMDNRPKQISFLEIYDIWKSFILNCYPPNNISMKEWYEQLADKTLVKGAYDVEKEDVSCVLFSYEFLDSLSVDSENKNSYTISKKQIQRILEAYLPKKIISDDIYEKVIVEAFGEPNAHKKWRTVNIRNIISKKLSEQDSIDYSTLEYEDESPF